MIKLKLILKMIMFIVAIELVIIPIIDFLYGDIGLFQATGWILSGIALLFMMFWPKKNAA